MRHSSNAYMTRMYDGFCADAALCRLRGATAKKYSGQEVRSPEQFTGRPEGTAVALERDLGPHRNRVELRADISNAGRARLLVDGAMQIVEHEPDVTRGVPVQAGGVDGLLAACDSVGEAEPVVEIDHAVASGDFPGAPASSGPGERVCGNDTAIGGAARIVGMGFAGKRVARLDIAPLKIQRGEARESIHIVEEVFALGVERAVACRHLDAVDLRAFRICDAPSCG